MTLLELTRSPIKFLPEHLIDQIKAGEIAEGPAAILKELLENSIDAKAQTIRVNIVNNGLDVIHIEDDGIGMTMEELPRAFSRHATSKLDSFEKLYSLLTYGFRGEALASVASISRITCSSVPREDPLAGGVLEISGGVQNKVLPYRRDGSSGTAITVCDLFYNTPARLKFIRGKNAERNALKRVIYSTVLANPTVAFSFRWDGKERENFAAAKEEEEIRRVAQVFFKNKDRKDDIIPFSGEYNGINVKGFVSNFSSRTHGGQCHIIAANNRPIQDHALHRVILKKGEKLWPIGERGHYFVNLKIPQGDMDVNVHPRKVQVKFFQGGQVFH